ncbi:uncharacterized protein LOC113164556 isoform X2 [Anabas testudineus]|uniref:uncharacterized protein LOC113164556 isoform X2 n=1 Tax=Anabas testudineus TaxID=64144 RepID=UPI000E454533|nr:uncharacterized protein LOC113164556 isoform X2 [Anabas testudineus]
MACSKQSALQYIRSVRRHLERDLKNLSVIVENLYQQKVFSDEDVRKIRAEKTNEDKTRRIVNSVIKKGEDACYELLRIIDTSRKRTLERSSRLDQWISCFSFREDAQLDTNYLQGPSQCHRYQEKLKSKAKNLSEQFWTVSKNLFEEKNKPKLSYTSLVLNTQGNICPSKIKKLKNKKSKWSRPKKLRTYFPEDKSEMSPSKLLKKDEDILLVGKPGIGKTTLALEMLKIWAERDTEKLDYMFYFDMRETAHITKVTSLEDLLFSGYIEPDEDKEEVLEDIKKYSDNVTIIFDGLTDLSSSVVKKLVEKDLLQYAKIIITCRPDDEDSFSEDFLRVEVKGFSEQTIKTYLSATLGEEQKKVLNNLELFTLCHVPMYALMVAACCSSGDSPQPCTITEIYINIVRLCFQMNGNNTKTKHLNSFISSKREEILGLAEVAFLATEGKTVNLTELSCEDRCVLSFLKSLDIRVSCTETETKYAFLHYTVQEFFAAVWLLKNPDKIKEVVQQCLTEEKKHMKHLIPFMCRLLNEKNPSLMKCLIPALELRNTSNWFFQELINTVFPCLCEQDDPKDSEPDFNIQFLFQCLYESQSPEACIYLLDKLDYCLDLSGENLDPHCCCAVAYVVTQSKDKKIRLNLEDATVSENGMRRLLGCFNNVRWCDPLPRQLWEILLASDEQMDHISLLRLDGNRLHLSVEGKKKKLFERAVKVMKISTKVNVCLYWDRPTAVCQHLCESLLEALPNISSLSFVPRSSDPSEETRFLRNLVCRAAEREQQTGEKLEELLSSVCRYKTFPIKMFVDFLTDLYSETKTGLRVLPSFQSVFQSTPSVWSINLSKTKSSILLEMLKLQPEKKQVKLTVCSYEESEVRSFLQCLPYISQLSFNLHRLDPDKRTTFLVNLFCAAAEREQQTGEKIVELLSSVCRYETFPFQHLDDDDEEYMEWKLSFLLDLFSHVKDCVTKTGLRVLPSFQSVFQSTPSVWFIDLSETKTSILLEMLKLQPEKKQVKLTKCSYEESEVRSFLQCLPYISKLSFNLYRLDPDKRTRFLVNLFCAAAEREQQTGEKIVELLSSVCRYETFPFQHLDDDDEEYMEWKLSFLLDLFSHVKDCVTKTGLRVLPSLQSVFQSTPSVWSIDLSETKTSILLEMLKLQPEKKQVKLTVCSYEESEVRSFLQCLPYISQLSFNLHRLDPDKRTTFLVNLFCAAAEREQQTGEKIVELLSSVCRYETFPFQHLDDDDEEYMEWKLSFLLDLFSHVKDCVTKTGLRVLPSFQSVFQSTPSVWFIDLSETKTSILLEMLKLQPEKKQVKLTKCSYEESEVRSFLQCLPYISKLSFNLYRLDPDKRTRFLVNLFCAAAEREQQTGEKIVELLSSVCRYETFPFQHLDDDDEEYMEWKLSFLLDLFSHVKDCVTKTGLRVLPSLQSVFQSTPSVWSIDLSETKTSILLEMLKLQPEKKQVKLTVCSYEESEVRSFLQCLPYISQLSFNLYRLDPDKRTRFLVNLFCAAAEREQQTGEKIVELLSSVCRYETFPFQHLDDDDEEYMEWKLSFLLDLFSHVKDCVTKTGLRVLPSFQSVFQSTPSVWFIDLSETKTSILLEMLKLQPEKKQVELTDCSDEQSEVRSFLQCLPYISQLSFNLHWLDPDKRTTFLVNLFCAAAEREQQTGEKIVELLSSVCRYETFPFQHLDDDDEEYMEWKLSFLLDLFSHVKDCVTKTGLRVLSSFQSVFQSTPSVWSINLAKTKTSILLEMLKLQPEKKQVKLTDCSDEESEVRSFLQCLPYISQLSCRPDFFQRVCSSISVRSRAEVQQLVSLLQLLSFNLLLTGELPRKTCCSVGRVLRVCGSDVDLVLTPRKMSVRGASVLFRRTTHLHSLRLSSDVVLLLIHWVRRGNVVGALTIQELSVAPKTVQPSERVLLRVVSSLASLLRHWTVGRLDLTDFCVPAQSLIPLLLHAGPLTIKLSEDHFQQLLMILHEIQDRDLTRSFLNKVVGDLTSCQMNWEILQHLLLSSPQIITVDLRKNPFLQENVTRLLPFVDRIKFKKSSPSFVLTAIREIYEAQTSHIVPSLLRSLHHVINLTCRELDSVDCAALIFTLTHSPRVQLSLNLVWTLIPTGEVEQILSTLDKVSQLSVDRKLLLSFIHCCSASDVQQEAASGLIRTLQHRVDLSCSSCVELSEQDQTDTLSLGPEDCRAVCTVLSCSSQDVQLDLRDCEVDDSGLDLLFPVLHRVQLRASKAVLLQLVSLVPVNSEGDSARRAESLCRSLGGELDLSHTPLDQRVCGALALVLNFSEGLTELDLSHCELTDQLLLTLITHLHKVQVLDLSHNKISDAATDQLLQLSSINPSIQTVRLFNNNIKDRSPFEKLQHFEIW